MLCSDLHPCLQPRKYCTIRYHAKNTVRLFILDVRLDTQLDDIHSDVQITVALKHIFNVTGCLPLCHARSNVKHCGSQAKYFCYLALLDLAEQ